MSPKVARSFEEERQGGCCGKRVGLIVLAVVVGLLVVDHGLRGSRLAE
jgi:hypothetical protein